MRILQVSAHFPPHIGGVETHVMELSKHLTFLGHTVEVLTTTSSSNQTLHVTTCPTYFTLLGNPILRGVRKVIRKGDFDVVHLHTPPQIPVFQMASACKSAGIPAILTYHCDGEVRHPLMRTSIPIYMRTFGEMTFSNVERIITTTSSYATTSPYLRNRKTTVVPSGVNTERFNRQRSPSKVRREHGIEDEFVVGFVGRLVGHKGLYVLLEAVRRLNASNVTCLIVGEGYMRGELEDIVQKKGMRNVIFADGVSDDMLPDYYAAFDVFVLPSVSREEAFGGTVIEAMASGTPVLVSRIPGPDEVVDDGCGLYFKKGDVKELEDNIRRLLKDEGLRGKMGELARKQAEEEYDWRKIAKMIEGIYREVVI